MPFIVFYILFSYFFFSFFIHYSVFDIHYFSLWYSVPSQCALCLKFFFLCYLPESLRLCGLSILLILAILRCTPIIDLKQEIGVTQYDQII
jgi:hypothetical protein